MSSVPPPSSFVDRQLADPAQEPSVHHQEPQPSDNQAQMALAGDGGLAGDHQVLDDQQIPSGFDHSAPRRLNYQMGNGHQVADVQQGADRTVDHGYPMDNSYGVPDNSFGATNAAGSAFYPQQPLGDHTQHNHQFQNSSGTTNHLYQGGQDDPNVPPTWTHVPPTWVHVPHPDPSWPGRIYVRPSVGPNYLLGASYPQANANGHQQGTGNVTVNSRFDFCQFGIPYNQVTPAALVHMWATVSETAGSAAHQQGRTQQPFDDQQGVDPNNQSSYERWTLRAFGSTSLCIRTITTILSSNAPGGSPQQQQAGQPGNNTSSGPANLLMLQGDSGVQRTLGAKPLIPLEVHQDHPVANYPAKYPDVKNSFLNGKGGQVPNGQSGVSGDAAGPSPGPSPNTHDNDGEDDDETDTTERSGAGRDQGSKSDSDSKHDADWNMGD